MAVGSEDSRSPTVTSGLTMATRITRDHTGPTTDTTTGIIPDISTTTGTTIGTTTGTITATGIEIGAAALASGPKFRLYVIPRADCL